MVGADAGADGEMDGAQNLDEEEIVVGAAAGYDADDGRAGVDEGVADGVGVGLVADGNEDVNKYENADALIHDEEEIDVPD